MPGSGHCFAFLSKHVAFVKALLSLAYCEMLMRFRVATEPPMQAEIMARSDTRVADVLQMLPASNPAYQSRSTFLTLKGKGALPECTSCAVRVLTRCKFWSLSCHTIIKLEMYLKVAIFELELSKVSSVQRLYVFSAPQSAF